MISTLRSIAMAATPGLWFPADWNKDGGPNETVITSSSPEVLRPGQSSIWPGGVCMHHIASVDEAGFDEEQNLANAKYIATFCPDLVLKMMAVIEAAQNFKDAPSHDWDRAEFAMYAALSALQEPIEGDGE